MKTSEMSQTEIIALKPRCKKNLRSKDNQKLTKQDRMVLAQRQKYRSMEQNRKPRDKCMHLWTLSLTKEARIYDGKKTISLTSGAGKTGQSPVKD